MRAQKNKKRMMIAMTAGLVLAMIIFGYLSNLNSALKEKESKLKEQDSLLASLQEKTTDIVNGPKGFALVAKGNIYPGTKLKSEMLEIKEIPMKGIENDIFQDVGPIKGKMVVATVMAGQPILKTNLDLNYFDIPNGMRAVTIPIEFIQGLASYINVGSRIDVVSSSTNDKQSDVVLQNVKVLAFEKNGASNSNSDEQKPTAGNVSAITLEIPAIASANLVSALSRGKIQLLMRNVADGSIVRNRVVRPKTEQNYQTPRGGFTLPPAPTQISPIPNKTITSALPEIPSPARPGQGLTGNTALIKTGPVVEVIKAGEKQQVQFNNNDL